jgi:DNA-binding NtrC family response regulator
LFETAHGGTLFLDEIGEMSPATQSKLLRVLEARRILRVGGSEEIPVDVRILTATHRDLDSMVERGEFRQDLLFRLNAFSIRVPPLRERTEDILPMSEVFLREASQSLSSPSLSISASAARLLCSYHWPGNVRELKNAMERAAVLADGPEVLPSHLPEKLLLPVEAGHSAPVPPGFALQEEVAQVERETLVRALEACGGNRTHAAERLGISRRALLYKIDKYGLKDIGR